MKPREGKNQQPQPTRILIVDDHPITRQGLAQLIDFESDLTVCGEAPDAREAQRFVESAPPDLVVLDITLPDKSGLELIKDLMTIQPNLLVLVISMHEEGLYAERVLRAGGRGYIMKQEGGKKIMHAIRRVLKGEVSVSEEISTRILKSLSGNTNLPEATPGPENLTDREFEVFELIGDGKSTKEIAAHLNLSVKTIEVHRLNIKKKLELGSAHELARYAIHWRTTEQ